jgi:hypothetical protein
MPADDEKRIIDMYRAQTRNTGVPCGMG